MTQGLGIHSDQQLFESIRNGNQKAFGVAYDKYAPALYGVINRITLNAELAENVLQQTFYVIWENREKYQPEQQNFFVWMAGIARSLANEALRLKSAGINAQIHRLHNSVYTTSESKKTEPDKSEIEKKVSKDSSECQEALKMICVKGYTLGQAAKELNLSPEDLKLKLRTELSNFRRIGAK